MKVNKSISIFLLLITLFMCTSQAYAYKKGDTKQHSHGSDGTQIKSGFYWTQKAGPTWTTTNTSNLYKTGNYLQRYVGMHHYLDKKDAYCIDSLRRGDCSGTYVIANESDVLKPSKKSDYVLLYMINEGSYSYVERTVAIRAFLPFTSHLTSNGTLVVTGENHGNRVQTYANYNSGLEWASGNKDIAKVLGISDNKKATLKAYAKDASGHVYEREIKRVCECLDSKINCVKTSSSKCKTKLSTFTSSVSSSFEMNESDSTVKNAKQLFNKAVSAAATYKTPSGSSDLSIKFNGDIALDDYIKSDSTTGGSERRVSFSLNLKGVNSAALPVTLDVTPDSKGFVKLRKLEYRLNNTGDWKEFKTSDDLRTIVKDKSVVMSVRAYVYAPSLTDKEYINVTFKAKANYYVDGVPSGAIFSCKNNNKKYQRFAIGGGTTTDQKSVEDSKSLRWDDTKPYCKNVNPNRNNTNEFKEFLKKCCKGQNAIGFSIEKQCRDDIAAGIDESKSEWCKKKQEYCDVCLGTESIPTTCSNFSSDGETPKCEGNLDAVIKDSDNAKLCVVDYYDDGLNSYQLKNVDNVANNPYCNVYCKEDYKISLPLGRWIDSGRSFTLSLSLNGTKTCYTDLINTQLFEEDLRKAKELLDVDRNNQKFRNNYTNIIKQYQTCTEASWNNDIKITDDESKPSAKLTLTYEESDYLQDPESDSIKFVLADIKDSKSGKMKKDITKSTDNKWLCNGTDIDDYYNKCINGVAKKDAKNQTKKVYSNYYDPTNFTKTNLEITYGTYSKKVSNVSATYVPDTVFYTKVGSGVIAKDKEGNTSQWTPLSTSLTVDQAKLYNAGRLPVTLKKQTGAYKFNVKIENIGEYYGSTNKLGRLVGKKSSVADVNEGTTFSNEYICNFTVNCPECKTSCVEDPKLGIFCQITERKTTPGTPGQCVDCKKIDITSETKTYSVRQISLNDVNPSDRDLGFNLSTLKGSTAVKDIEEKGETVYNEKGNSKPEVSVTLTPSEINKVKDYNKKSIEDGKTYASFDDMTCKNYSSTVSKLTDEKVLEMLKNNDYKTCTSNFLRSVLDSKNVSINTKIRSWYEICSNKNLGEVCTSTGLYGPAR